MILVLKLQLASSAVKYFPCPKDAHSSSQDTTVVFGKWKKAAHICFFISRLPLGVHSGWTLVAPLVWHLLVPFGVCTWPLLLPEPAARGGWRASPACCAGNAAIDWEHEEIFLRSGISLLSYYSKAVHVVFLLLLWGLWRLVSPFRAGICVRGLTRTDCGGCAQLGDCLPFTPLLCSFTVFYIFRGFYKSLFVPEESFKGCKVPLLFPLPKHL